MTASPASPVSSTSRAARSGRRIRFSMCGTGSSSAASPRISDKIEFGKDPSVSLELLLRQRSGNWLHDAATAAMRTVQEDFAKWSS